MLIIGCDYHPSMQQIAFVDTETGERGERRLMHRDSEAERFYRELKQRQIEVRVGMEATGYARWFERLLAELVSSCGLETQPGSESGECANRRRTVRMRNCCCDCSWKRTGFHGYGCRARRIGICVSSCGIDIAWYKCERGS